MDFDGRISLNGEQIKKHRLKQCLSRDMFSSKSQQMGCYLSVSTLKRAEAGSKIYYRTAQDIASILKVSLDELKKISTTQPETQTAITVLSRDEQIHRASSTLGRVKSEHKGSIIFIQGEPGIGKSHFIHRVTEQAKELGFINFRLPIYDGVTSKRQILQDLIRKFIDHSNTNTLKCSKCHNKIINYDENYNYTQCLECFTLRTRLNEKEKTTLFILFGKTAHKDKPITYKETQINELNLLFSLIKNLDEPINIILEDIHWASTEIISIIQNLTHEARYYPLILILSSRLINSPLYQIWNNTVLNTPLELFNLCPLNKHELSEMIDDNKKISRKTQETYIDLSNGNPLFFRFLLEMQAKQSDCKLPNTLNSLVKQQLSLLSHPQIYFLRYTSALGHEFDLTEVEQIPQIQKLNLTRLIEYNFFVKKGNNIYEFHHDLIRQSIYQNMPEEVKIKIHDSAALFYQNKDQTKLALHLRKAKKIYQAKEAIRKLALCLYEKHDYSEALNQVDIALALPGEKNLYSLYYMKGVLLKILDLPAKATQYLKKALRQSNTNQKKLQIHLELTEIYAVNQRFKLSHDFLSKAKSFLSGAESDEDRSNIEKYTTYLKKCTYSLNSNLQKINYQQSQAFKTSIQNFNDLPRLSTKSELKKDHKVALLHSTSGFLKEHEEGVLKASIMAFDEINKNGGLLDHQITYEIFDGQSNEHIFRKQAKNIIYNHHLTSIFGCSTSPTRKQVKTIVEDSNNLLIYPFHYEGLESSENIIYTGPTSSLQASPIIDWLFDIIKPHSFYFIGSDYIYPVVTNEILKDSISIYKGDLIGEDYLPIGATDFQNIINKLQDTKPDVIILTLASVESNKAFLKQYHESTYAQKNNTIIVSLVLSDSDIIHIPIDHCRGIYGIFSYFQNNNIYSNDDFIQSFKLKYGKNERVGGYMESAYVGVKLWAKAIQKCQSFEPNKITQAIKGLSYYGPGGIAYIDEENQHIWRHTHIAQVGSDGEFHIKWSSEQPTPPTPYPLSRPESEWNTFLQKSKARWDGGWGI
ncbi:transporter substrate-binding protein [Lentisphaera profundi]|uniref:Transporter substrate-binding protein n=1 Tax=Lentisphaera profundi TaxID=1658616 RepID=A0ABY7VQ00_9BACT|nr:transporter substrate-binding protein [Lentisphaera profundi]WDE95794.1 transporter substrate-binding protein [Lentisphaera profundi]